MNQELFDKIKRNYVHSYLHKGRQVYCLIHPHHLSSDNGYRVDSLQKFFDEEEGSVYYETYEKVKVEEVNIEDIINGYSL